MRGKSNKLTKVSKMGCKRRGTDEMAWGMEETGWTHSWCQHYMDISSYPVHITFPRLLLFTWLCRYQRTLEWHVSNFAKSYLLLYVLDFHLLYNHRFDTLSTELMYDKLKSNLKTVSKERVRIVFGLLHSFNQGYSCSWLILLAFICITLPKYRNILVIDYWDTSQPAGW